MGHSTIIGKGPEIAVADDSYDLEEQLATAEHRYAEARAQSRKAREECLALETESNAPTGAFRQARMRYQAVEARCKRLRRLIDTLEERLG